MSSITVLFNYKPLPEPHGITLKVIKDTKSWDQTQAHQKIFK